VSTLDRDAVTRAVSSVNEAADAVADALKHLDKAIEELHAVLDADQDTIGDSL
jgi:hypothetical protein